MTENSNKSENNNVILEIYTSIILCRTNKITCLITFSKLLIIISNLWIEIWSFTCIYNSINTKIYRYNYTTLVFSKISVNITYFYVLAVSTYKYLQFLTLNYRMCESNEKHQNYYVSIRYYYYYYLGTYLYHLRNTRLNLNYLNNLFENHTLLVVFIYIILYYN